MFDSILLAIYYAWLLLHHYGLPLFVCACIQQILLDAPLSISLKKHFSSASLIRFAGQGHYFYAKQHILRELCVNQASAAFRQYTESSYPDTLSAFNSLLYHGLMIRDGQERMLSTLLPLSGTSDGDLMIAALIHAQEKLFFPEIERLLLLLKEEKQAFWNLPSLPELAWHTYSAFYGSMIAFAGDLMSGAKQPGKIVSILDAARFLFERTLDLPYGSMEIIRADEALSTINQALKHNRYLNL